MEFYTTDDAVNWMDANKVNSSFLCGYENEDVGMRMRIINYLWVQVDVL